MKNVRVTLIDGRIVDGRIVVEGKPKLMVEGKAYNAMDAVLKGMSVWPADDPLVHLWQKCLS